MKSFSFEVNRITGCPESNSEYKIYSSLKEKHPSCYTSPVSHAKKNQNRSPVAAKK